MSSSVWVLEESDIDKLICSGKVVLKCTLLQYVNALLSMSWRGKFKQVLHMKSDALGDFIECKFIRLLHLDFFFLLKGNVLYWVSMHDCYVGVASAIVKAF